MIEVRFLREYDFKEVEAKWQGKWENENIFKTENKVDGKENYYVLEMLLDTYIQIGSKRATCWRRSTEKSGNNKKEKENCDFFQFMINWKLQNNKICPHDI